MLETNFAERRYPIQGAGKMKYADRLESSEPLIRVFEIPDPALNEQLVPMNDNSKLTILSGENLEAGSVLGQRDSIEPRNWIGPVVTTATAFSLAALVVLTVLLLS
jgi:hypothetical protein